MPIVVVGANGKDVGKTALVCAVITTFPEFKWTAMKIRGHDYEPSGRDMHLHDASQPVCEELSAGQQTDTARYLAAGARRALLVTRSGPNVPIDEIRRALGEDRNVIFESNRIVDAIKPDVCLALIGDNPESKPSFMRLLRVADAVVSVAADLSPSHPVHDGTVKWIGHPSMDDGVKDATEGVRWFRLESVNQLTPELTAWMRERLSGRA